MSQSFPKPEQIYSGCSILCIAKHSLGWKDCGYVSAFFPRLHESATSLLVCLSLCNPQQLSSSRAGRWELLCKSFALGNNAQKSTLKELSCCTLQHCCCILKIPHGHSKTRANQQLPRPITTELWEHIREELRFCFLAVFVACLLFLLWSTYFCITYACKCIFCF